MMLFPHDGHLKLAVLDPENVFHPPVDCKPEFCPAGAQGPVQETAQVLQELNTNRPHGCLRCVLYRKVTVVYLL